MRGFGPEISGGAIAEGPPGFVVGVIVDGMNRKLLQPEGFLRRFTPHSLAAALASAPQRRARLLEVVAGMRADEARKASNDSFARAVSDALQAGDTDAELILQAIPVDTLPKLGLSALWAFALETEFWAVGRGHRREPAARAHARLWIESAHAKGLLSGRQLLEGLSDPAILQLLPAAWSVRLLQRAVEAGRHRRPLADHDLDTLLPWPELATRLPLRALWVRVLRPVLEPLFGHAPTDSATREQLDHLILDDGPMPIAIMDDQPRPITLVDTSL